MSKTAPPVPPDNQTRKGPKGVEKAPTDTAPHHPAKGNTREQGETGNIYQNTHNQGYQQNR